MEENKNIIENKNVEEKTDGDFGFWIFIISAMIGALFCADVCGFIGGHGASMQPTFKNNQAYPFIRKELYYRDLERFDIVGAKIKGENRDLRVTKRIVGLPGEKVEITKDSVYINGVLLENKYVVNKATDQTPGVYQLADDEYFLMGDNAPVSYDSRIAGPVKKSKISSIVFDTKFF